MEHDQVSMDHDALLHIDGIRGDCTIDRYKGWLEIRSFRHAARLVSQERESAPPIGRTVGEDVVIRRTIDSATPCLALACHGHEVFKTATIEVFRLLPGNGRKPLYRLVMQNVVLAAHAVEWEESRREPARPAETLSIRYEVIEWGFYDLQRTAPPWRTAKWNLGTDRKE